jgi:excisionase family DNA binding protein
MSEGEKLLKVEEVKELISFSSLTIRRWLREGKLKGIKVGKEWRIPRGDLQEFLGHVELGHYQEEDKTMTLAEKIREHVYTRKVVPAKKQGQKQVTVKAGMIHDEMGLSNRVPAVCGGLDANKFVDTYPVKISGRRGPHQGRTAEWDIEIL